jgi:hypothetical protein
MGEIAWWKLLLNQHLRGIATREQRGMADAL